MRRNRKVRAFDHVSCRGSPSTLKFHSLKWSLHFGLEIAYCKIDVRSRMIDNLFLEQVRM